MYITPTKAYFKSINSILRCLSPFYLKVTMIECKSLDGNPPPPPPQISYKMELPKVTGKICNFNR